MDPSSTTLVEASSADQLEASLATHEEPSSFPSCFHNQDKGQELSSFGHSQDKLRVGQVYLPERFAYIVLKASF